MVLIQTVINKNVLEKWFEISNILILESGDGEAEYPLLADVHHPLQDCSSIEGQFFIYAS